MLRHQTTCQDDRLRGCSTRCKNSRATVELATILLRYILMYYTHGLNTYNKKITFSINLVGDFEPNSSQKISTCSFEATFSCKNKSNYLFFKLFNTSKFHIKKNFIKGKMGRRNQQSKMVTPSMGGFLSVRIYSHRKLVLCLGD